MCGCSTPGSLERTITAPMCLAKLSSRESSRQHHYVIWMEDRQYFMRIWNTHNIELSAYCSSCTQTCVLPDGWKSVLVQYHILGWHCWTDYMDLRTLLWNPMHILQLYFVHSQTMMNWHVWWLIACIRPRAHCHTNNLANFLWNVQWRYIYNQSEIMIMNTNRFIILSKGRSSACSTNLFFFVIPSSHKRSINLVTMINTIVYAQ